MKNKIIVILLILSFVISISCAFAEDSDNAQTEIGIADDDALSESEVESVSAPQDKNDLDASDEEAPDAPSVDADEEIPDYTEGTLKIEVLNHNYKVGDKVKVRITVTNLGPYDAENVKVGFGFSDKYENPDGSLKLIDDGKYAVSKYDTGYYLDFGFLGKNSSKSVVLTFKATETGKKTVQAGLSGDYFITDEYDNDTFTVTKKSISKSNSKTNTTKKEGDISTNVPAGNPIALLLLSLFCVVPYCFRR